MTFKPHTGTKTSVLFVQKWHEELCPKVEDYPIFSAVSEKDGKDNSGDYIYVKNGNGQYKLDNNGHLIVDHDLHNNIMECYNAALLKPLLSGLSAKNFLLKRQNMQRIAISIITLLFFLNLSGCTSLETINSNSESPELSGDELRLMLYKKISNQKVLGYNNLWSYFPKTDLLKNTSDVVWDIYSYKESHLPYQFIYGKDECGSYKKEGDCYNREHSFPQSWWGGGEPPMKSDLFHIYPTDGKVNGLRANYPYGEVKAGAGSIITENGSKLGQSATDCYKGKVFEPVDEFKGDLARGYFYLLTRYMPQISSWKTPVLEGNNFSPCFKTLLLKWSEEDPVSEKEKLRNEIIKNLQGNYNPFIEDFSLIKRVWVK